MFDEEMITKYRYIILLLGTAVSFVFGFVVAFALAKLCGVMAVKAVLNIAFTAGGITGMLGFVCICLAELRRIQYIRKLMYRVVLRMYVGNLNSY